MSRASRKATHARIVALLRVRTLMERRASVDLSRARQADDLARQAARTERERNDVLREALAGRIEDALTDGAGIADPDARYAMFVTRAGSLHAEVRAQRDAAARAARAAREASVAASERQIAYAQAARRKSGMEELTARNRRRVIQADELHAETDEIARRIPGRHRGDG